MPEKKSLESLINKVETIVENVDSIDSSLDESGVDLVVSLLKERVDKYNECIMVISHRKESSKIASHYKNPGEVVFNQKIIESLASGASLPDDILSRLIMQEVRKTEDEIAKSNAYNGWVVVGFPLLKSQGELLVEANFKPDQVIVLDAPEDEEEWVKLMTTRQTAVVVDEIKTVYPTEFERENYINESNAIVEVFSGAEINK